MRCFAWNPLGQRLADAGSGIFWDVMQARHRQHSLVGPGPAELPQLPGQDAARVGVEEQLGHRCGLQPLPIGLDDLDDVGGLAFDRQLPRPLQRRPAVPRRGERASVGRQLLLGQITEDRPGEPGSSLRL